MRRLSIQLTCLLTLLPALGLGCKSYEASDFAYAADEKREAPSTYADAAPGGGAYEYSDDVATASVEEGSAPPSPSPAAEPSAAMAGDGEGVGSGAMGMAASPSDARSEGKKGKASSAPKADRGADKIARDELDSESEPAKIAAEHRNQQIQSGTLTAGSFDDNLNPWVWDRFVDQARAQSELAQIASAFAGDRTVLTVQDAQGRPLANASVEIDGKRMVTRTDGKVVYVKGWDGGNQAQGKATIKHAGASKTIKLGSQVEQLVTLDAQGQLPTKLDIALVIDATGSMGDELEYLKVEIRDIAEAIHKHFPNVDQRFALIVYRDDGDSYTTRVFDFTGDIEAFQKDLSEQQASGGGDYPEAMDAAMKATEQLSWRSDNTARVTFLVADAPPHSDDVTDTLEAVDGLRSKGVAIYPVASSGVAGEAEFVMRAAAMLTGAQYLFLTDDSGVGNSHAEPHIPCYTVEQLAPLMVRAVRSELSGHRVEAEEQFTIRTVGQGQSGVCSKPKPTKKIAG